jgi:hypothetical protein
MQIRHPLLILYTGPIWAGVHTTLKALDPATGWCPEERACLTHRAYGKHVEAEPTNYIEELSITFERRERTYDLQLKTGQQRGSLGGPITSLLDIRPEIREGFEWMKRCDAIVFVVNPKTVEVPSGEGWLMHFREDLILAGRDPDQIPLVFQFNKQDMPVDAPNPNWSAVSVETLEQTFQWPGCRYVRSIALQRVGVFEALGEVIDLYEESRARRADPQY